MWVWFLRLCSNPMCCRITCCMWVCVHNSHSFPHANSERNMQQFYYRRRHTAVIAGWLLHSSILSFYVLMRAFMPSPFAYPFLCCFSWQHSRSFKGKQKQSVEKQTESAGHRQKEGKNYSVEQIASRYRFSGGFWQFLSLSWKKMHVYFYPPFCTCVRRDAVLIPFSRFLSLDGRIGIKRGNSLSYEQGIVWSTTQIKSHGKLLPLFLFTCICKWNWRAQWFMVANSWSGNH